MNERIMIRIHNDSSINFENCWLGAGPKGGATETKAYGKIASGQMSRYKNIEPIVANYRKIDIVAGGTRYLDTMDPQDYVGNPELAPGWYTFAYEIVGDALKLTVTADPPPGS